MRYQVEVRVLGEWRPVGSTVATSAAARRIVQAMIDATDVDWWWYLRVAEVEG